MDADKKHYDKLCPYLLKKFKHVFSRYQSSIILSWALDLSKLDLSFQKSVIIYHWERVFFVHYLDISITALSRNVIIVQSNPIYVVLML